MTILNKHLLITLGTSALALRLFHFIIHFTVNVPVWDQWDIFDAITGQPHIWSLIRTQHNEHRLGIGLLVSKLLATLTAWDILAETLFIGIILLISCLLILLTKYRLTHRLSILDLIIPWLMFTLYQWENLLWGFQISFVLPLLTLLLAVYLMTFPSHTHQSIYLLIIAALSSFMSFHGLFVTLIISIYFFYKNLTLLGLATTTLAANYFIQYQPIPYYGLLHFDWLLIIKFLIIEINSVVGITSLKFTSLIIPLIAITLFVKVIRHHTYPIFALYFFSWLFATSTAIGRGGIGLGAASVPRYVTLMIPLYLGMYLSLRRQSLTAIFVALIILMSTRHLSLPITIAATRTQALTAWKNCYLTNEQLSLCDIQTGVTLYHSHEKIHLAEKLQLLKSRRWSFYR